VILPTKSTDERKLNVGDWFILLDNGVKVKLPTEEGAQVLLTTHDPAQKIDADSSPPPMVVIKRVQEQGPDDVMPQEKYRVIGQAGETNIPADAILSRGQEIRIGEVVGIFNQATGRAGLLEWK